MTNELLCFFSPAPQALKLFEPLYGRVMDRWPGSTHVVHKTQITFLDPRGYLMISLPRRRGGGLLVSFGLSSRLQSPRLLAVANPAPGRFTHHVQVTDLSGLDEELFGWISLAHDMMAAKHGFRFS